MLPGGVSLNGKLSKSNTNSRQSTNYLHSIW
jgi:hypothetical protein